MSGSGSSNNTNNTGSTDLAFSDPPSDGDYFQSHALRYWVPTASKLSRGKKGIIQRMFTGEPLNNLCNVYIYNQTSKLWYHEHTIQGDPNRGGSLTYPSGTLTSSSQTLSDGITYTTSASIYNGDAFRAFSGSEWRTNDLSNSTNYYPHNAPLGYVGAWVAGTYVGSNGLGSVSGEWIKMELSTSAQPNEFTMRAGNIGEYAQPDTFTILGSNDDSNWTNLGNFTNTNPTRTDTITGTLAIGSTYTYFAIVFTKRRTDNWNTGYSESIIINSTSLFTNDPSEDFGRSLDGTDTADMVAVGAPGTWFGSVSNISGYARVFTKNSSGNGWTQRGSEVSQQGGFGHSVALSQYDGNILVVGAPFYNTLVPNTSGNINFHGVPVSEGKVYIYMWDGANYTLQQTLNSPSGTLSTTTPATWKNFYFGYSLGITDIGDKIIVGEPSIRNIWYEPDQLQGGPPTTSWTTDSFQYTGNAHVYDNVTVLSGGTTWTSNVSMTSVIGTTGIGTTDDTNPLKVRWLDALGTSVDINRAGTRILAGGPGSYGTSNTAPHAMSGRIYTLDWDPIDAEWKEMGEIAKHIVAPQGNMLLGKTARFDGSGRRIVSGATGYIDHIEYYKGNVLIFDFNGDQWVSFPNEMVELAGSFFYWTNYQHKLGESISIDGEGEMVAIGKNENHYDLYNPTASPAAQVSGGFTVDNITYIGGATTSVAGSDSQISTGASTIWVYNISQSMVIKGNITVGGYIQGTGISIGTNDDSSTSNKSIYFGGSKSDNAYELTVIENRVYEAEEKAELLIFKGNDNADASGGGTYGPDRIRLKGGQIVFDLNAGYDRTAEDIRAVMHRNAGGAGMLGINVNSPTEVIHVDGKIKATQGFIGRGTELTGLNFNYINNINDLKFGQAGATQSSTNWGEITVGSSIAYPTLALNNNSVSGYTVTASTDSVNAWKAFNDSTGESNSWELGNGSLYSNGSANRGGYLGSTERIAGYKGEWIELQMPDAIYLTRLDVNSDYFYTPRITHVFGSNDGVTYDLIQGSGDLGYLWTTNNGNNTIFTRTPDYINEDSYNRILIIVNMVSGGNRQYWANVDIYGKIGTFYPKVKLDKTGKIGILNTNPSYPLDVTGDINLTGDLRKNGVIQTFGGGGSSVWSLNSVNAYYNSGNVGIGTSTPSYPLDVTGDINLTGDLRKNGVIQTFGGGGSFSGDIAEYITHTGNTSNDLFGFPGNNEFKIRTGGTDRFYINSSGDTTIGSDIDIGTGHKLTVVDGSTSNDGSYADLVITNMSEHNNARLLLGTPHQTTSSSGFKAAIIADGAGTYSRSDLHFCLENSTSNEDNADLTDSKMVIKYDTGNVGIGITSPAHKLDVSGSVRGNSFAGSGYSLTNLQAGNISSGTLAVARGGTNISSYSTGEILYSSAGSLTKLSIGSPGDVLTVAGGNPTWAPASGGGSSVWSLNGTKAYYNSGNVGINTSTPQYKLDVNGDINMSSGSSLRINGVAQSFGGGSSVWSLNGTKAYYNSGNVGIGTTSPGYKLDVDGDINMSTGSSFRINGVAQTFGGGGGGGATAGTASVSTSSNEITVSVSGGPYDYMYNETSYDVYSTSSTFDTLIISTAMTQGQKLVLKLHTTAIGIQGKIERGSSLSVNIDGTSHTVFSNFQDHTLHIPYDNSATTVRFLILEITKENTNQVTIEAKLSAADFTKTREFDASWNYNGIHTFNRDSAIHNVAYNNSSAAFNGSTFQLRLGYLGVGHSHDFYFTQTDGSSPTFQASQIEFYYNNSLSSWSQASQTNVYTNFDKSVGMTLTYNKEYRIHHEVIQASTDDYPSKILFTVEELNAASGGGGGGGSYGTGDFETYITTKQGWQGPYNFYGIEIGSSFSPSNYNFNGDMYNLGSITTFDAINLEHTLPTSLPFEYEFYFNSFNGSISTSFKVRVNGSQRTTYNSFPGSGSSNMSCQSNYRYRVLIKPRNSSYQEWSAEWREYRS